MVKVQLLLPVMFSVLLLVACAPQAAPTPQIPAPAAVSAPAPAAVAPAVPARPAWQVEWERVQAEAEKEGRVLISATNGEFRPVWAGAMKNYGIRVEMIIATGRLASEKIMTERRTGIYSYDVYMGGSTTPVTTLKPKGAFDPMDQALILPEVKDPKLWFEGSLPYLDKEHMVFGTFLLAYPALGINTNAIKPGEIKSYNNLLDPRWRGKIAMLDPTEPGNKFTGVVSELMGWDYVRKLAETKPLILTDNRQLLEWLAHGKAAIVTAPQSATLNSFRDVGAPVAPVIPQEGSWLSVGQGGCGLFNRAANPNAARVFLNWLLSKEGQTATSKVTGSQSARVDVPTDFLDPMLVRDPTKKFVRIDTEDYLVNKQPEVYKMAKEIFGPLIAK